MALAAELGLAEHVRFAGFVPEANMLAYYRAADIYAHTGLQESFGLWVIEAAALGLPVVAVAEGGPLVTVRDGIAGILTPATPEEVAGGLVRTAAIPAPGSASARRPPPTSPRPIAGRMGRNLFAAVGGGAAPDPRATAHGRS